MCKMWELNLPFTIHIEKFSTMGHLISPIASRIFHMDLRSQKEIPCLAKEMLFTFLLTIFDFSVLFKMIFIPYMWATEALLFKMAIKKLCWLVRISRGQARTNIISFKRKMVLYGGPCVYMRQDNELVEHADTHGSLKRM